MRTRKLQKNILMVLSVAFNCMAAASAQEGSHSDIQFFELPGRQPYVWYGTDASELWERFLSIKDIEEYEEKNFYGNDSMIDVPFAEATITAPFPSGLQMPDGYRGLYVPFAEAKITEQLPSGPEVPDGYRWLSVPFDQPKIIAQFPSGLQVPDGYRGLSVPFDRAKIIAPVPASTEVTEDEYIKVFMSYSNDQVDNKTNKQLLSGLQVPDGYRELSVRFDRAKIIAPVPASTEVTDEYYRNYFMPFDYAGVIAQFSNDQWLLGRDDEVFMPFDYAGFTAQIPASQKRSGNGATYTQVANAKKFVLELKLNRDKVIWRCSRPNPSPFWDQFLIRSDVVICRVRLKN